MGSTAADAIAARLDHVLDRVEAARALALLSIICVFEPLAMMLDFDTMLAESMLNQQCDIRRDGPARWNRGDRRSHPRGRIGSSAKPTLAPPTGRRAARHRPSPWHSQTCATWPRRRPTTASRPVGRLYVIPVVRQEPIRRRLTRTAPSRAGLFQLEPVDEPIVEPVSKFGGQPVWIGDPTWPLSVDGAPATLVQAPHHLDGRPGTRLPRRRVHTDGCRHPLGSRAGRQPGPASVPFVATPTGPTSSGPTRLTSGLERYMSRRSAAGRIARRARGRPRLRRLGRSSTE